MPSAATITAWCLAVIRGARCVRRSSMSSGPSSGIRTASTSPLARVWSQSGTPHAQDEFWRRRTRWPPQPEAAGSHFGFHLGTPRPLTSRTGRCGEFIPTRSTRLTDIDRLLCYRQKYLIVLPYDHYSENQNWHHRTTECPASGRL